MLNNRNVVGIALIVSLLVLLSGCATNAMTRAEREQAYNQYIIDEQLESVESIQAFRFSGWNELSDKHLIINTGVNRPYLITLRHTCVDLDFAQGIKINNTGSRLRADFDSISVPGNFSQRCFIDKIYKLSKEQRKTLISLHRNDNADEGESETESETETDMS